MLNGSQSSMTFTPVDRWSCLQGLGSGWPLKETGTCTSFSQDSNDELHDLQNGQCVWEDDVGSIDYEIEGTCNGNNYFEYFDVTQWGHGSNPYPYVNGTIAPYYPAGTGYVLDVHYNNRSNGTPVDIAPYNGSSAQFWTTVYQGNGWYTIELTGSNPVMCLDKPGGQNGNGTQLEIWQCNGGANQKWGMFGVQFVNQESGTCLDAPLLNFNNPVMDVWSCNGGMNQDWESPY